MICKKPGCVAGCPVNVDIPAFVELALPAETGCGQCILEWEDAAGSKMRVELRGFEAPDLAALTRSFREDQP